MARAVLAACALCALTLLVNAQASPLHLRRSLQQDATTPPALPPQPPLTADPITFDWSLAPVTTPDQDAPRYQEQLDTLLTEPLSEWQAFPADGYTLAFRPIVVDGVEYGVSRTRMVFTTTPDSARPFFEFLVTPEGFTLIDPATQDLAESRAASVLYEGPNGATVFNVAEVTEFPESLGGDRVIVNAYHWQLCGPSALTLYAYPSALPEAERRPSVVGAGEDYSNLFALRVTQVDSTTLTIETIFWFNLFPEVTTISQQGYFDGLVARVAQHLAATRYAPVGNEVCDAGMGGAALGGYGYGQ